MNPILSLLLISLCGVAHAIHLPVVSRPLARRQMMAGGKPAVHMQQVPFVQNVENARDIVVRIHPISCRRTHLIPSGSTRRTLHLADMVRASPSLNIQCP